MVAFVYGGILTFPTILHTLKDFEYESHFSDSSELQPLHICPFGASCILKAVSLGHAVMCGVAVLHPFMNSRKVFVTPARALELRRASCVPA